MTDHAQLDRIERHLAFQDALLEYLILLVKADEADVATIAAARATLATKRQDLHAAIVAATSPPSEEKPS